MRNRIFSTDSPKAIKANGYGYLNAIQYMAPHRLSGYQLCGNDTKGCRGLCLGRWSGAAIYYSSVNKSRIAKARRFVEQRDEYLADMIKAMYATQRKARKLKLKPAFRPNGSTDIPWENIRYMGPDARYWGMTLFDIFPDEQFIDYTKDPSRLYKKLPANYHLTLSRSESNEADCIAALKAGHNVAVVFDTLPETWNGFRVINGDAHDLRHLDPKGVVVGLTPKGFKAKRDKSGFVVRDYAQAA